MLRPPHENVAIVLVEPSMLRELELELVAHDLWLWLVAQVPTSPDGPRQAFQIRHRLVQAQQGRWDDAAAWSPAWVSFGQSWRLRDEPLPWAAHTTLWRILSAYDGSVRYRRRLVGVPPLPVRREVVPSKPATP